MTKNIRFIDKKLLKTYHTKYCVVCSVRGCDPAHIKSVGSGGDDVESNLMALCRIHHTEQHKLGWSKFASKHNTIALVLGSLGWFIDENGRIRRL